MLNDPVILIEFLVYVTWVTIKKDIILVFKIPPSVLKSNIETADTNRLQFYNKPKSLYRIDFLVTYTIKNIKKNVLNYNKYIFLWKIKLKSKKKGRTLSTQIFTISLNN